MRQCKADNIDLGQERDIAEIVAMLRKRDPVYVDALKRRLQERCEQQQRREAEVVGRVASRFGLARRCRDGIVLDD